MTLVEAYENPMFSPAEMAETDRAIAVSAVEALGVPANSQDEVNGFILHTGALTVINRRTQLVKTRRFREII